MARVVKGRRPRCPALSRPQREPEQRKELDCPFVVESAYKVPMRVKLKHDVGFRQRDRRRPGEPLSFWAFGKHQKEPVPLPLHPQQAVAERCGTGPLAHPHQPGAPQGEPRSLGQPEHMPLLFLWQSLLKMLLMTSKTVMTEAALEPRAPSPSPRRDVSVLWGHIRCLLDGLVTHRC